MKRSKAKRRLALLLALMVSTSVPVQVSATFAEENENNTPAAQSQTGSASSSASTPESKPADKPDDQPAPAQQPAESAPSGDTNADSGNAQAPAPTKEPQVTPTPTPTPTPSPVPEKTAEPMATAALETSAPEATPTPTPTPEPEFEDISESVPNPEIMLNPEETDAPGLSDGLIVTLPPEHTDGPEATPVPDAPAAPGNTSAPSVPSSTSTPVPESPYDPNATPGPEEPEDPGVQIPEDEDPAPDDDSVSDENVNVEPAPSNPYSGWHGVVPSGGGGMPIPMVFQTDYPDIVCVIRGIPRSVASSGCGATSISMVIAYLTGNTQQTPYTIFYEAAQNGMYQGAGFTHEMISYFGKKHGVEGKWIGRDGDAIIAALKAGKPVIAHMGPGIFTSRGHYVVLRGVTPSGKILLNDPVSPYKSAKAFPIETLLTQSKSSRPFMICWTEEMEIAEKEAAEKAAAEKAAAEKAGAEKEAAEEAAAKPETAAAPAIEQANPIGELPQAAEVIADLVNLRMQPGTGEIVTQLAKGARVYATEQRVMNSGAVWYGIPYAGQTLYLMGEYLSAVDAGEEEIALLKNDVIQPAPQPTAAPAAAPAEVPAAEPAAEPAVIGPTQDGEFEDKYVAYVSCDSANLRNHIGTDPMQSLVIWSVPNGTAMYVIDEELCYEDGYVWCKVLFRGRQLYVRGDLLEVKE